MAEKRALELRRLFLLKPGLVFLNHGSFGACPKPVMEAYQAWQLELEGQPVEFLARRFVSLMSRARQQLAAYVACRRDDLVFTPNATTALNAVARSLPLQPGDEVLSTNHEYGAIDRTWRFVCELRRARYVQQPIPLPVTSRQEVIETIWSGVTENTRVLSVSHVTSPTALILPIETLIDRARERRIITVVDGAHAPGQLPINLHRLGADFYAGNCHKWMCAPKGSAFLYARPKAQPLLQPLVVSWGWHSDHPSASRFVDEQEWQGTRDIAAYLSVPTAITFLEQHRWEGVRQHCHELASLARQQITRLTGLAPVQPDSSDWYAQMVTLPLPLCNERALQKALHDRFGIEVPVSRWHDRSLLRVSVQGYNTRKDIDALTQGLADLLPAFCIDPRPIPRPLDWGGG
jgi:isopenicillin-N epimerase